MQKFFPNLSKIFQLNNLKVFFLILILYVINSYDQNIWLIFYFKDGSHVRLWHPYSCVYIRAQRQYTAVQKIRTPLKLLSLPYIHWPTPSIQFSLMYANPLLIVQTMYSTSKGQTVYYSTGGWFLKIFILENLFSIF